MNGGTGRRMACRPLLSPPCLTASPVTRMSATARRIGILPCKDERKRPFLALNAGGTIRRMKPDMPWQTRGKDRRNPHPPRHFDPVAPPKPKLGTPARRPSCCQRGSTAQSFPPRPGPTRSIGHGAFNGCNNEPPTARECGQKRHGMDARRAETAKRVRFTTARRAEPVPRGRQHRQC